MVFCSKCGQKLPDNAYFCFKCGARTEMGAKAGIPAPIDNIREAFSTAGQEIEKAFRTAAAEIQKAFGTSTKSTKGSESQQPIICPSCGRKIEADANYCNDCGKKLH